MFFLRFLWISLSLKTYPLGFPKKGMVIDEQLFAGFITCVMCATSFAATWTVDDDGVADFDNIQAAVDYAANGDEIVVMAGIYTSPQLGHVVDMLGKTIWLHSDGGPETTIIDGQSERRCIVCVNGETNKTIIEGFTITGGSAIPFDFNGDGDPAGWFENDGGGVYCEFSSSPSIDNCIFTGNAVSETNSSFGGAMFNNFYCNPLVTNCAFTNNSSENGTICWGGAIGNNYNSNGIFTNCLFTGNAASSHGGAVHNFDTDPIFVSCRFENNMGSGSYSYGGAIYNYNSQSLYDDCVITNNVCDDDGGAMWNDDTTPKGENKPTITNSQICSNAPNQIGGLGFIDGGGNVIADECPAGCEADIDGDGGVGVSDALALIAVWGCASCSNEDLDNDGVVGVGDILIVVGSWGPCDQ